MLPKEEKVKKKPDSEQPGLFDKENEKDRISKKRKIVYLSMFLTIGLSISFWAYRSLKNFSFSPPQIPKFNFTISNSKTNTLNLSKDQNSTWSFFLKRIDIDNILYQENPEIIFNNIDINSTLIEINSTNSFLLPGGAKIKELIKEDGNNFSYISKIIIPNQELLLIIKITDSKDLEQSKKLIPNLVDRLYWYSLQK